MFKRVTFIIVAAVLLAGHHPGSDPAPQDDFFGHVNEQWLSETSIPAQVPWTGTFVTNTLEIQAEIRAVIEDIVSLPAPYGEAGVNIASYWRSLRATDVVAGMKTMEKEWRQIDEISGKSDLVAAMCRTHTRNSDPDPNNTLGAVAPLSVGIAAVPNDPDAQILFVEPAGLGLPDPDYYSESEKELIRAKYRQLIMNLMNGAGQALSAAETNLVIGIERSLAAARMSDAERHDASTTFRLKSKASALRDSFEWAIFFSGCNLRPNEWLIADEDYFSKLADTIEAYPTRAWKLYLKWHLARRYAPFLSDSMRDAHFDFYDGELLGNTEPRAREEIASLAVDAVFSNEIEQFWLSQNYNRNHTSEVRALAEEIRVAFRKRISRSDLFSARAKSEALRKLEKLNVQIGHPDRYPATIPVRLNSYNPIANTIALQEAKFERRLAEIHEPRSRERWYSPAYDTSAYYVRSTNTLAIPAGMLRAPWFDPDHSRIENFAGVGVVIAHEMAHAFDDQGSQYDAEGALRDWWERGDRARFEAEIAKLVAQYSAFEILPGVYLDGERTVSEAYADLAGLIVAHEALLASYGALPRKKQNAITQKYLTANCRVKRALFTEQLLRRIAATESHAPNQQRCNGPVSAFDPFYEVLDVRVTDDMYLSPGERARIF